MKKRFFGIFLLFLFVPGAGFSQAAPGEKVTEDVTISPENPLSFPQQERIANLAVSALKRIAKARGFIHDKNMGNARRELAESQLTMMHSTHACPVQNR